MRIVSNYKDYYDSLQDFDSIVWNREYKCLFENDNLSKRIYKKLDLLYYKSIINKDKVYINSIPIIIGFCGEYYKYSIHIESDYNKDVVFTDDFFYPKNKIIYNLIDVNEENTTRKLFGSSFYTLDISFLKSYDLFIKYNSPVLLIHPLYYNKENRNTFNIIINPSLKRLGYHKKKDIQQVYQELDMFVSGVLCNNKEYPVLQDKHRQGSRFDKYSFRKLPEKSL